MIKQRLLYVQGRKKRGVVGSQLVKMIETAQASLLKMNKESSRPKTRASCLLNVLLNLFTVLDFLSGCLSGEFDMLYCKLFVKDTGASKEFIDQFQRLEAKCFEGTIVGENKEIITFMLWDIWRSMKENGVVADVDLCKENGQNMLKVGKVVFPFDSLVEYVEDTRQLVIDAKL